MLSQSFARDNLFIKVPGKRLPLELREAQLDTVRQIVKNRDVIILKARQVGFSTLLAAFCLWCVMGGEQRQIYMLSKGQRESRASVERRLGMRIGICLSGCVSVARCCWTGRWSG